MKLTKLFGTLGQAALVVSGLGLVACSGAPQEEATAEQTETTGQALDIPNPNGSYFASVSANGTGCPAGSWSADISPDGQTFTVTFSKYETTISPGKAISVKDCQLGIKLHSPQGLSFSVGSLYYSGYAFLDSPGMTGRQTAKYYFQGNPIASNDGRTDLVGPYDSDYTYTDNVPLPDLVWSRCGTERMLNVGTRVITMNNDTRSGSGYMNTSAVDGSLKLIFKLSWKHC